MVHFARPLFEPLDVLRLQLRAMGIRWTSQRCWNMGICEFPCSVYPRVEKDFPQHFVRMMDTAIWDYRIPKSVGVICGLIA